MKRHNHITTITVVLTAVLLLAACTKSDLSDDIPSIPAGMGELTLGKLLLSNDQIPASEDHADKTATRAGGASTLPSGATLRLYAFKKGDTEFDSKLTSRTYTIDAVGTPQLDAGQEPIYLPLGDVDIYLAGPVNHAGGDDVAAENGIYPRTGVDLIVAYATTTIVKGQVNPLPDMLLNHKMALVQVVVAAAENAVFENLILEEVKFYDQPTTGSYTLNSDGGTIMPHSNTSEFIFPSIKEETSGLKYSATSVLIPQPTREFKIEALFKCNQKNETTNDSHPTLSYRQSALLTKPLEAGLATRFSTLPQIPVEIKWRTKVLPWNDIIQDETTIPGGVDLKVPTTPPTADQYVEINGLQWAKGNLIAKNSLQCMVGQPSDYGLYFQFGSLVGWTGGSDGSGKGQGSTVANNQRVWPVEMGTTKPTFRYPNNNGSNINTLNNYYFNYSANGWNTEGQNLHNFAEPIADDAGSGNLASGRYAKFGVGDPCTYYLGNPWRLPTQAELVALEKDGYSNWLEYKGANGRWFGPENATGNATTAVFLPAAGNRNHSTGEYLQIGAEGLYGTTNIGSATQYNSIHITSASVIYSKSNRSSGYPARCVSKPPPPPTIDYIPTPANSYIAYPDGGVMQGILFNATLKPRNTNKSVGHPGYLNSTESGTSNYYTGGVYTSGAMSGKSLTEDLNKADIAKIEVVWQTLIDHGKGIDNGTQVFTNYDANATGKAFIKDISYDASTGYCTVLLNGTGNALIAAYDADGAILWSWHIWGTDTKPEATIDPGNSVNGAGKKFMDRNLGALSSTATQPTADNAYKYFGLLYQWGRKEPFTGAGPQYTTSLSDNVNSIPTAIFDNSGTYMAGQGTKPIKNTAGGYTYSGTSAASTYTLLSNPTTHYNGPNTGIIITDNPNTWTSYNSTTVAKSIYDPCPYGYRVPKDGSWSDNFPAKRWIAFTVNEGHSWKNSWWPAAGRRTNTNAILYNIGYHGYSWSSSRLSVAYSAYYLYFNYNNVVNPSNNINRSTSYSVRCIEE